jgi:hypothetical protein
MRVRQDRRAATRYLAVPAGFAASLLSRVRAPSSAPFGGADRRFARGRRGTTGATWTCRRCGAVAEDLVMAQRHVATVPPWRASTPLVCGGARRLADAGSAGFRGMRP